MQNKFPGVQIDGYVIMPNHIHMLLVLREGAAGASPRPTVPAIICAYKSMVTRLCKAYHSIDGLFQTSFYEHVIRNRAEYEKIAKYISENPYRWQEDELHP